MRRDEPLPARAVSPLPAAILITLGMVALGAQGFWSSGNAESASRDWLALSVLRYLCFLWAGGFLLLGTNVMRRFAFPAALMAFIIPMPIRVENAVEVFFQHASADAAAAFLSVTGSTYSRDGLVFHLPGIAIQVAQECSGIRSTLVLFITSAIAGHMFLKSPWRRLALALFVISLAIIRNGFRIFTIATLCVQISPNMIDSPIHHRGGPVFFVLSLIPFFLLLLWLQRGERRHARPPSSSRGEPNESPKAEPFPTTLSV
jgi:exosortase C (VPDSG-CTERM-specific)